MAKTPMARFAPDFPLDLGALGGVLLGAGDALGDVFGLVFCFGEPSLGDVLGEALLDLEG